MTMLDVADLRASLGGQEVLKGVSMRVGAGEFVGLIGPNGAGKSTLLRAVLGLARSTGTVTIDGRAARELNARARARKISYLPQEREIAWPVSVERLVALGRAPHLPPFSRRSASDDAAVREAMARMEVEEFADREATALSGGEKARVLIARALAQGAPLMLADEPTAGLDPAHQITLMRIFAGLAQEGGSVVACLHDLGLAARWCTRLVLLDKGRIVADGAPDEVLTAQTLRSVYNIEAHLGSIDGRQMVYPLDLADGNRGKGSGQ